MVDFRRIMVILAIAVLFGIFVFSTIEAITPGPDYMDYCPLEHRIPVPYKQETNCTAPDFDQAELDACVAEGGNIRYGYDANGCIDSWECSFCEKRFQEANSRHNFWNFIIAAIMGVIGVIIGLFLPMEKESVHEWVGSGLMLGGVASIFIGTANYFSDLHRWARPILILIELLLVILLSYKKLAPEKSRKKRS